MEAAPYSVELHLHTCYSFLEGASLPEELALRAADLGYKTLAITDHDGLYGAMDFAQTCAAAGVPDDPPGQLRNLFLGLLRESDHLNAHAETIFGVRYAGVRFNVETVRQREAQVHLSAARQHRIAFHQ